MTMKVDWLRGCATALVTPFTSKGAVDEDRLRALIEYQIAGGVRLLVPCGTTGESATMTDEEDQLVIKLIPGRMGDYEIVAQLRRCQCKTVGNSHWQRLGMPSPGQQKSFATAAELFANRHHVSQGLAGMVHCRFQVDYGDFSVFCKSTEHWVFPFLFPVF